MINLRKVKTTTDKLVQKFNTNTKEDKIVLSLLGIAAITSVIEVIVVFILL